MTAGAVVLLLLGFASAAAAAPNDFDYWHRDVTDSTDVVNVMPTRATSTPAFVGGVPGSDNSAWYYVGNGFTVTPTTGNPGIGQTGNEQVGLDSGWIASHLDISSLADFYGYLPSIATKENSSNESNDVSNLQNEIDGFQTPFNMAAFMGSPASTTQYIASSTPGFMSGAMATQMSSLANPTFGNVTLAVNTARQPSTTTPIFVTGSIDITTTLSLTGGTSGKVTLQEATSSSFASGVTTVAQYTNSNTGTLTIGLNTSQIGTAVLSGVIPPGYYYRFATTNITGTPTYSTPIVTETSGI